MIQKGFLIPSDVRVSFRLGYEGDFIVDGRMNQFDQGTGRVDCYVQNTESGTVTLNFLDRLDLYGVLGSAESHANWRVYDTVAGTVSRIKVKTANNLLGAVGARAILYQWRNTFLGLGGRYSLSDQNPRRLSVNGLKESVAGSHFHWREWQINMDLCYKIRLFTPYVGAKYSHARTDLGNFSVPIAADGAGSNSFENRDPVGFYVGCGLSNGHFFMFNLEGRLIDEEAVTLSADFRF